ncbi:MAG: phenylalanine--tRNA ligase subunit beta [Deltaproteobacteria bacterium]|nr:phenylalanine--tRNA ligase subunit beta [Deltaproteobacteria bacterium]
MKFTLNWLKEFVDFTGTTDELAKLLTMAGLEVESVSALTDGAGSADQLIEIGVTPNRGDCLGIAGIAREVAALTGASLKSPPVCAPTKNAATYPRVKVRIDNRDLCPRYSARVVDSVQIAPSPGWLRARLEACGFRAINNVVDVTNYVMLETGQPLHAFDLERLTHKQIVVRRAHQQEKIKTLDGVERELALDDLLICDNDVPVALAGVMGGSDSEVIDSTRTLLLESANFAPASIRRTAKRLALRSEASHRFERGVDPQGTLAALDRAVYLLGEIAGAQPVGAVIDRYPRKAKPTAIVLREARIEKLLGVALPLSQAEKLLRSIGMKTARLGKGGVKVFCPTSRPDISREADLIEELARLHGYDRIPSTLPWLKSSGGKRDYRLIWERKLRSFMAGEGLAETINLPFTSETLNRVFPGLWSAPKAVPVLNPLAKDNGEMRHSLLGGLIENLKYNLAHKTESVALYHLGKTFALTRDVESAERQVVGGILFGPRARRGLRLGNVTPLGFFECKGLIETLLEQFDLSSAATWSAVEMASLHPGQSAQLSLNGVAAGYLGQLHPDACEQLEVPTCCVFELDFEKLLEYAPRRIAAHALPRFPAVERDVALVVDGDFAAQKVIAWIATLGEALIEHVDVFDQYFGAPIPEGKKSLAYKVSYRAEDRTLTDLEVNTLHQSLVERLGNSFGAERRS